MRIQYIMKKIHQLVWLLFGVFVQQRGRKQDLVIMTYRTVLHIQYPDSLNKNAQGQIFSELFSWWSTFYRVIKG